MDLESAIVGAIVIALCIVPLIIIIWSRKKREKQLLNYLTNTANQHNSQITQYDFCGDFVIGMDEAKNYIFFSKMSKDKVDNMAIDLAEIQKCRMVKYRNQNNQALIERLDLNFTPVAKNKPMVNLAFFDAAVNIQLNGELQLIEKWSKTINDRINHKTEHD